MPVPCGLIGTLGTGRPPQVDFTGLTTPDPVLLQRSSAASSTRLQGLRDRGLLGRHRRAAPGRHADRVAVFTNFTQDHLDYHGSMEAYWARQGELFSWPGLQAAMVNVDDEKGARAAHVAAGSARSTSGPSRARRRRGWWHAISATATRACASTVAEGAERHALATRADRPVQRVQPAGRARRHARAGRAAGRRGARLRRPAAGARAAWSA